MSTRLTLDSISSGSPLERSYSSSSLRSTSSKQGTASPGRVKQKSFGRQLARVAAALVPPVPARAHASVPVESESENSSCLTISLDDTEFVHELREESVQDLPPTEDKVDHEQENMELRAELEILRQELLDLRDASSKNDEVWQRENARLKGQLAAANAREEAQQEQLRVYDGQLTLCRQELHELQEYQLKVEKDQATSVHPRAEEAGSSGLGRERDLLKLVVQLVGASNVRAVLHENPNANPTQVRQALVRLRCPQCRHLSPSSRARPTAKSTGSYHPDSLHKILFGTSSRPPSPTAIRFNSMRPRSPH